MSIATILEYADRRIIYSPSEEYSYFLQKKLTELYPVEKGYRYDIESDSQLREYQSMAVVPPHEGEYWSFNIRVGGKKLTKKLVEAFCKFRSDYGYVTLWVKEYRDFMFLQQFREIRDDDLIKVGKFGYLSTDDARSYYKASILYPEFEPPKEVVNYLIDNYRYDVKGLTKTVGLINGGREIDSIKELIQIAGLGNTTVDNLLFKLLKSSTSTASGVKKLYGDCIFYLDNLNAVLEDRTIFNYMNSGLNTIIDMKLLMIRGMYKNSDVLLPTYYDMDKFRRYTRYEKHLEHNISLIDLLNLKASLTSNICSDYRITMLRALSDYMDYKFSKGGGDMGELQRKKLREDKRKEKQRRKEEDKQRSEVAELQQIQSNGGF